MSSCHIFASNWTPHKTRIEKLLTFLLLFLARKAAQSSGAVPVSKRLYYWCYILCTSLLTWPWDYSLFLRLPASSSGALQVFATSLAQTLSFILLSFLNLDTWSRLFFCIKLTVILVWSKLLQSYAASPWDASNHPKAPKHISFPRSNRDCQRLPPNGFKLRPSHHLALITINARRTCSST